MQLIAFLTSYLTVLKISIKMKKILIIYLLLSLILNLNVFAQNSSKFEHALQNQIDQEKQELTVWIYFTDKGKNIQTKLSIAEANISQKSIERRKKLIKTGSVVDFYDIPVEESYIHQITPFLKKIRHNSRWLNAISAEIDTEKLKAVSNFDFVQKIDIVRKGKSNSLSLQENEFNSINNSKSTDYNLNYGASLTQVEQINVPYVHDLGYSGNGITICVMDAGFNYLEHQSFGSLNIIDAYDFVNDDDNVDDEGDMGSGDHGTKTLSTIAGFYEGELIGPAYGADYILAKTENTDSETQIEEDHWVAAAEWADLLGVDITSTSLSYTDFDDGTGYTPADLNGNTAVITVAGDIAAGKGILVVNSAGNYGYGTTTIGAPADGDSILAVGAVYSDGTRTSFSSCGPTGDGRIKPEVMAMGSSVIVASPSGQYYTSASGTSFSCPLTAGAAALLWEMVPSASNMEIFDALKMTANNADSPNNQYGWGIIDVYAAYEYLALPKINHIPLDDTEDIIGPYSVECVVNSNSVLINNTPKLFYRRDNGSWNELIMELSKEDYSYSVDIPGNGTNGQIDYYILAENENASITLPENAPVEFYTFMIEPDNTAPIINHNSIAEYYIHLWPQARIIAQITDNTELDTENTTVIWKVNGVQQSDLQFIETDTDMYTSYFPYINLETGDMIEYKIFAQDNSAAQNSSVFPANGFQTFYITDRISFEENQFSHNWEFTGNQNWFVSSDESQHGLYSAESGNIDHNQSSSISIHFTCDETADISFYKKVSCEDGYTDDWDYLKFEIDGTEQDRWDGEVPWSQETYSVNSGSHTLSWVYIKDVSVSSGSDCAWIDNITLPGISSTYTVDFDVSDGYNPIENANVLFLSQNKLTNNAGIAVFDECYAG
jgi:serine protease AprX